MWPWQCFVFIAKRRTCRIQAKPPLINQILSLNICPSKPLQGEAICVQELVVSPCCSEQTRREWWRWKCFMVVPRSEGSVAGLFSINLYEGILSGWHIVVRIDLLCAWSALIQDILTVRYALLCKIRWRYRELLNNVLRDPMQAFVSESIQLLSRESAGFLRDCQLMNSANNRRQSLAPFPRVWCNGQATAHAGLFVRLQWRKIVELIVNCKWKGNSFWWNPESALQHCRKLPEALHMNRLNR